MLIFALGNATTATTASKCTGNSATATKLQNARNIKLQGAVSGNANFDGSANIVITTTQANIVTLTGNVSVTASSENTFSDTGKWGKGQAVINYPSGFSSSNCVVISIGIKASTSSIGYNFGSSAKHMLDIQANAFPTNVVLNSDKILLNVKNPITSATTLSYKVILMKVS